MGGSGHNNIYTQYYEIVKHKKIYIKNPSQQFGGAWFDDKTAIPPNPTDAQVAAEALKGVAKFGYDPNGSYVVATAHDHSTDGFGTTFCAYHSDAYSGGDLVAYTNLPYIPDAGADCGANFISPPKDESGTDEGVTIIEGSMEGESVTNPVGTGWYFGSPGFGVGSPCAWSNIGNDTFGSKSYTMQPMFSIASESCVQTYN